jgi:hypothetical protein
MKISEALALKIKRVRYPFWHKKAYLKLPIDDSGNVGVWCYIFDEYNQKALDIPIGSQAVPIFAIKNDDGYEEYFDEIYCTDIP